jgi:thiol-disulfide isomerase/thioredoxin
MIVQSILILGFINVITTGLLSSFFAINSTAFIFSLFIYALPVLVWYTLKPYILKLQEFKKNQREYLRIKYDFEIFDTLLKKQQLITVPVDGLGIDFGNPHAENSLIKVCNPFCGPCAKAHSKLEELVTENKNIRIKIIFMVPNREEASAYKPTAHLLAIAESKQKNNIKQALDDWYLAESKDYERFAIKYPMNGELKNQGSKMNEMYRWCEEMKVTETPTLFLNGYKLPETYDVTDLAILLAE